MRKQNEIKYDEEFNRELEVAIKYFEEKENIIFKEEQKNRFFESRKFLWECGFMPSEIVYTDMQVSKLTDFLGVVYNR